MRVPADDYRDCPRCDVCVPNTSTHCPACNYPDADPLIQDLTDRMSDAAEDCREIAELQRDCKAALDAAEAAMTRKNYIAAVWWNGRANGLSQAIRLKIMRAT